MNKKTILIDLAGVLNKYSGNFNEKYIEPIAEGAYEFIKNIAKDYRVVIFTSRNLLIVSKWIFDNGIDKYVENITNVKQPAYLIIDDRCINFNGNFQDLKKQINNFKVWYK